MIPFAKTTLGKEEKEAVARVIDSGWVVMGKITEEFEAKFAEYIGAKYCVFVDSGTSALFLATRKLLIKNPIIKVPSLTFTATAEVIANNARIIRFEDVDDSMCLAEVDEQCLPVHLTGVRAKPGALVYDSAHRIEKDDMKDETSTWCYSLYATKNMTTIQGGMIATNNEEDYLWFKKARDHGISKGTTERYKDGKWQYSIDFIGFREKSDDVHAAIGIEQLKKLPEMTERRNQIVMRYNKAFKMLRTGNHLYPILVKDRNEFIDYMAKNEVQVSVHFLPLHTMPAYNACYRGTLDKTKFFGERLVSLPLYPSMTNDEVDFIIKKVLESNQIIYE